MPRIPSPQHMGTSLQVSFIPEKPTKQQPLSAISTRSPAPSTPAASCPHHTLHRNSKARSPRHLPQVQQGRHHRAPSSQRNPRPHTKMEQTYPARGPRPAASTQGRRPPPRPRNYTDTPHHGHCNYSPGKNIIQLSSTITAQPIQMLVTPHPRRGHIPPTPHVAAPHATL
ncbi:hypothetical protein AMECASPLE_034837 [Ameca splendens]|uniref:Uncharacterized protein n=1 Tax=Ameca splendens TaxID=208324 RepID=A0ABV0XKE4_9TELE